MRIVAVALLGALFVMGVGACNDNGTGPIAVDTTGTVMGLVWLDRNGNERLEGVDGPVKDVTVELRPGGGGAAVATAKSTDAGDFVFTDVPVGDYRAVVDTATVGDTLRVLRVDSARITVSPSDTPTVMVALTYPKVPIDTARVRAIDTRLFVEGQVLNGWATFADSTVHVRDTTGAIRAIRVPPVNVGAGDSIRMLGTTSLRSGEPVLRDVLIYLLKTGSESPAPVEVSTSEAAGADAGRLDADLVRVASAEIQDTSRTVIGELVFTVDDGSGPVDVVLDRDIGFYLPFAPGSSIIGTSLDITGLLVPGAQTEEWVIKPRQTQDVRILP